MQHFLLRLGSALAVVALLLAGMPVQAATAAGIVVDTAADQDNGLAMIADGKCGLREAIGNANADSAQFPECTAGSGIDTITFAGNYTITLGTQGQLLVTSQVNIQGNGAANTIIEADPTSNTSTYRVFEVSSTGNLTLDGLTVRNGQCTGSCAHLINEGGGILSEGLLTVKNSTLTFNKAEAGGGVSVTGGYFEVSNSTFRENTATFVGGGYFAVGGGVTTAVVSSTFSANGAYDRGGGIYSVGDLYVTNSTFSANGATNDGGGIYKYAGTLTMKNSTFSGNSASRGGAIFNYHNTLAAANTILANSTSGDCFADGLSIGTYVNNWVEDGSCAATFSGDPNLGALDYYGGTTRTHALLAGSPAIDAGASAVCSASPVGGIDQRGVSRPQGPACDIGAFELEQTTVAVPSSGAEDGWILESSENSGQGGTKNAGGTTFNLGDDAGRRQYRAILSFHTDALPPTAILTSATLRFKKAGLVGANLFSSLGKILADIKDGPFSNNAALEINDFQASASKKGVLAFGKQQVNGWYSKALAQDKLLYINEAGTTQFRLRFATDDNNNAVADYLKLFSGNATAGSRPQLIITYYMP